MSRHGRISWKFDTQQFHGRLFWMFVLFVMTTAIEIYDAASIMGTLHF